MEAGKVPLAGVSSCSCCIGEPLAGVREEGARAKLSGEGDALVVDAVVLNEARELLELEVVVVEDSEDCLGKVLEEPEGVAESAGTVDWLLLELETLGLLLIGVGLDGVEEQGGYRAASVPRYYHRMWGQEPINLGDIAEDEVEDLGDADEAGRWLGQVADEAFPKGGLLHADEELLALKELVGVFEPSSRVKPGLTSSSWMRSSLQSGKKPSLVVSMGRGEWRQVSKWSRASTPPICWSLLRSFSICMHNWIFRSESLGSSGGSLCSAS